VLSGVSLSWLKISTMAAMSVWLFQDDILDFVGSPEALGKPAGSDLKDGNLAPVLFAIRKIPVWKF